MYSSFLIINVCNQGKNLCSTCIIIIIIIIITVMLKYVIIK